jgi:D-serine deaminase-like pyridoxal phosphate-dependent protein
MDSLKQFFTPTLILDETILDNNILKMANIAKQKNITLRPHVKTPKSLPIVKKLLQQNAYPSMDSVSRI